MINIDPSNPVVFITIGSCGNFSAMLEGEINNYFRGAGFIKVPHSFDDSFVKAESERVWRGFLSDGAAKNGIPRVNFFVNADSTAFALPEILELTDKYFQALYPAGSLFDIYCLVDDSNLLTQAENKREIMQMLDSVQSESVRVYLLSNLSSNNTLSPMNATAETAALLALFKNCTPLGYVAEADSTRYNEFFILENCGQSGNFLTAASIILSVPQDALKALILAEILLFTGNDNTKPLPAPFFGQPKQEKSMDYLMGMAVPKFDTNDKLTREQWLARLFGNRLEMLDKTEQAAPSQPNFNEETKAATQTSLYNALKNTAAGGIIYAAASESLEAERNELQHLNQRLESWLTAMPNLDKSSPEAATRKLSPLFNQELFPYVLAHEFLKKKQEISYISEKIEILKQRLNAISQLNKTLLTYQSEVFAALEACDMQIVKLDEAFRAFSKGLPTDIFRRKIKAFIATNSAEMEKLAAEMTASLLAGAFPDFIARLDAHIEKKILPLFNLPIAEILQELTRHDSDIAIAISDWVHDNIRYSVRLKTGYAKLYTEANLFLPADIDSAAIKRHYEARGFSRINLFAKQNAGRIAVLYHAGAFDVNELYYMHLEGEQNEMHN